ncbi:MAG: response regulator transcription factor [Verrucomicrobiota bacterium]
MNAADHPTILIIDDEKCIRDALRMLLRKNFDVHCAEDVPSGLLEFTECQPDLVIIDYYMPGENGIQGITRLRQSDPHVPILFLTGFADDETLERATEAGATGFMRKPFDIAGMHGTIRQFIGQKAAA